MIKRTSPIFASILGMSSFLTAQELVTNPISGHNVTARQPVVEAGDLIPQAQPSNQVSQAEDEVEKFHFFEGFVSKTNQDELLGMVLKHLLHDPEKACEVVKEAIMVSDADENLVAAIVETACEAAPEKMRIIAQCAMAVSPTSLHRIQQVLAKLDPGGEDFQLGGKDGMEKSGLDKSGLDDDGGESGQVMGIILETSPISNPIPQIPPEIPTISPPPTSNISPPASSANPLN